MFRIATIKDSSEIDILRKQTREWHQQSKPNIFKPYSEFDKEHTKNFIQGQDSDILILKNENKIVAYMLVEKTIKPENDYCYERRYLYIEDFGVCENKRDSGFGTKLFQYCKQYAKQNGFTNIKLDVLGFNSRALNFYLKNGFEIEKTYLEYKINN